MPGSEDSKWWNWFFRSHSQAELKEWTARMRFFRFHRAVGGLANDGDTLRCAVRVETEAELISVASSLGITLRELPPDEPQPVLGKQYESAEMRRFRSRMEPFPRFQQLGRVRLASVNCFAQVWDSRLEIQISGAAGNPYEVTEEDVANAVRVEQLLIPFSQKVIQPSMDDDHCFHG
jgi:hypothetical protein